MRLHKRLDKWHTISLIWELNGTRRNSLVNTIDTIINGSYVGLNIITGGIPFYVNTFKFQSWTALNGKRKELTTFSHFAIRNKDVFFVLVVVCQISFPSPLILLVCSVQLALRIPLPPLAIQLPFHGAHLQHWHHWHLIAGRRVSILQRDQQPHLKFCTLLEITLSQTDLWRFFENESALLFWFHFTWNNTRYVYWGVLFLSSHNVES